MVQHQDPRKGYEMNKLEIATQAELFLNGDTLFGYNSKRAVLFAVAVGDNGTATLTEITSNGDVYELLESKKAIEGLAINEQVCLATCGWAAPVDDDGDDEIAPSQHPKKRRVRLCIFVNDEGVASVLRFQDDEDNPITDDGNAEGSLADAVSTLRKHARKKKK